MRIKTDYVGLMLFALLVLIVPNIARADMYSGFLITNPPVFFVFSLLGILVIEAVFINKKLIGNPRKAVWASFITNLITFTLGFIFFLLILLWKIKDIGFFQTFLISFILSVLIEGALLKLFYKSEKLGALMKVSVGMNWRSYLFLLIYLVVDLTAILVLPALFIVIGYFSNKVLDFMLFDKQIKKWVRIFLKTVLFVILIAAIFWVMVFSGLDTKTQQRERARDAKRIAEMRQIQTALELYLNRCGYYPGRATCTGETWTTAVGAADWAAARVALMGDPSLTNIPEFDPSGVGHPYHYWVSDNGQSYVIGADLEKPNAITQNQNININGFGAHAPSCLNDTTHFTYCVHS